MNYEKDKTIDWDNLHFEWARQPDLAYEYGVALARAKLDVDQGKEVLDVTWSKAFIEAVELIKSPVDKVKAVAEQNSAYLSALKEYNRRKYELGMITAAYDAIVQTKRRALEALVALHGQQYWSAPVEQSDYTNWSGKRFGDESQEQVRKLANKASREAAATRRTRTA